MKFPYRPRPHQEAMIAAIREAAEGGHLVLQAGTGSGKTIAALYGTLPLAEARDQVVLYLVRTNSQQRQVMAELRHLGVYGLALQGRHRLCLLAREDRELRQGTPEELSHFCRDRRTEVVAGAEPGCRYYRGLLEADLDPVEAWCREALPTAEETAERGETLGLCPYELNKLLAPRARLLTAPYIYFFHPALRRALLETMSRSPEDLIVIVDEAHNLPEYCREIASFQISVEAVERAEREVMDYGDAELREGTSTFDLLEALKHAVLSLTTEYVVEEDGFLPPSALRTALLHALTVTSVELRQMLHGLATLGEVVRDAKRQRGRLPRSYLLSLAHRLLQWLALEEVEFAKLVTGGENPALKAYCLDPSQAAAPLLACAGTVHLSGTLEPLREYRDSLALPESTRLEAFPSPFPPEHRRVVYVDHVTTRYDEITANPQIVARLREAVRTLLETCERNTLFLFPSYRQLETFLDLREGAPVPVHAERRGMTQADLMRAVDAFRRRTAALFAVVGGRISEGLDFPAEELEVVVLVGIPYPRPTAALRALMTYYDWKFQKGWEYCVMAPTARRLLQSVGRLIRSEEDRGIAILLDRRAVYFKRALGPMDLVEDLPAAVAAQWAATPLAP